MQSWPLGLLSAVFNKFWGATVTPPSSFAIDMQCFSGGMLICFIFTSGTLELLLINIPSSLLPYHTTIFLVLFANTKICACALNLSAEICTDRQYTQWREGRKEWEITLTILHCYFFLLSLPQLFHSSALLRCFLHLECNNNINVHSWLNIYMLHDPRDHVAV